MSAGSNNIVIQITDQVDASIQAKITGIGNSARQAAGDLATLQAQLAAVTVGTANLNIALQRVPGAVTPAVAGTGRLTGALAQLLGRVVGAEAGMGMLGGAFARVGVAAGVAGTLIAAALVVGVIVGYVLWLDNAEKAARKLVEAQIAVANQNHSLNDTLLDLKEELTGLTQGPLAKYKQMLEDLPFKAIKVDISDINKELEDQKSKVSSLVAALQRYSIDVHNFLVDVTGIGQKEQTQRPVTIDQAKEIVEGFEKVRLASANQKEALEKDLTDTGNKLKEFNQLEKTLTDENLAITEVSRKFTQEYYDRISTIYKIYLAKRKIDQAGANGEFLSEQRKFASDQLKQFQEEVNQLKITSNGVVSPADIISLRNKQKSGDLTGRDVTDLPLAAQPAVKANIPTLDKDIGNKTQTIARSVQTLVDQYTKAGLAEGAYSTALKEANTVQEINQTLTEKGIPINSAAGTAIRNLALANVSQAEVTKEQTSLYQQFQGPLDKYFATIVAGNNLVKAGAISQEQANAATAAAALEKENALNPLNEYTLGLAREVALLGQYGRQLEAATEVDRVNQDLKAKGYQLDSQSAANLTKFITLLNQMKEVQADINALQEQNIGTTQTLINQQIALNTAKDKGIISESQFKLATSAVNIALADQANLEGKAATLQTQLTAGIGKYIQGYKGLAAGISDAYGQAFATIADGAAQSLGRAIVYAENLGDALKEVARTVISQLLSAFIKLGIQFLVNELISKTVATAATAATLATASATATAWAPAAAFASLATLGANAAPAGSAIAGTLALTEALSLVSGKANGGLVTGPGTSTSDSILQRLSNGEFVVKASATARNRGLLESLNNGATAVNSNGNSVGSPTNLNVHVIHDGSTAIAVQQIDEHTVRVIAKQEARSAVQVHGPGVIAADLGNPNSRTSKAVNQNIVAPRKR